MHFYQLCSFNPVDLHDVYTTEIAIHVKSIGKVFHQKITVVVGWLLECFVVEKFDS